MTFPDDRDSRLEDLLRTTLQGEADGISPDGDGLRHIQERIAGRRVRRMWLRPLAAAGAVVLVGGAGVAAYTLSRPPQHHDSVTATNPTGQQQTPTPTPTPSRTATVAQTFPAGGMFPFTSGASERLGTFDWTGDPAQVALHFVSDFAGVSGVDQVITRSVTGDEAAVTLGRDFNGGQLGVTTVTLTRYDKSWIVVGAQDARGQLVIASPTAGARVSSPVLVSGPDYGADEAVQVSLRSLHSAGPLGSDTVSFGENNSSWHAKLSVTAPADPVGGVVAFESSAADGGPARLAVSAVRFASGSVQAAGYPRYFYGVKNGRVAKLASRNGATVSYLSPAEAGGGASDPQLVGDRVYYLDSAGTCSNSLAWVPVTGGTPTKVTDPSAAGYVISSYAVGSDLRTLAVFETACQPDNSGPQGRLISSVLGTATSHTVAFTSFPPVIVGDPSWEPDGRHLDAVVRTGNLAHVARYDAFGATSWSDSTTPCDSSNGLPTAVAVDGSGAVWVATQAGGTMQVLRCAAGATTAAFAVSAGDTPEDLAVTADGQAALVTDAAGAVWRWSSGSAAATALAPTVPQPQVSW